MFAGIVLGASLVVAGLMLVSLGKAAFTGEKHFIGVAIVGLGVAGAVIAIVLDVETNGTNGDGMLLSSNISLNDAARAASKLGPPGPITTTTATRGVASVPSLIEGLKRRLENEPDDASGWALLAQSYAFVGRTDSAEDALQHAVDLGLDEPDLRRRVEDARREPHTGLAGESTR
ncbi:MAG: hypothetical protein PVH89_04355 [Gammaproteobacteria bacterium]